MTLGNRRLPRLNFDRNAIMFPEWKEVSGMSEDQQKPWDVETALFGDAITPTLVVVPDNGSVAEAWAVGARIENRYTVAEICGGRGVSGMGIVYILDDDRRGRVAAKTFQHRFAGNLSLVERFLREARAWLLAGVHPNIVRAYSLDIIDAAPYIFMEYVPTDTQSRRSLADHIAQGALPITKAVNFAIQCCEGMIHATTAVPGLVHRDLKPENLLITPEGILKITDFGLVRCHIAKRAEENSSKDVCPSDDSQTQLGEVFGTPAYMAPEQFVEAGTVTMAADIYAFGCCFYEALYGQALFHVPGDTILERVLGLKRFHLTHSPIPLHDVRPDCPPELAAVIMKCLEKDPNLRWPDFQHIREQLFAIGQGLTPDPEIHFTATPANVTGDQTTALRLLDGYERAIRMRYLRENRIASPYTFHLALASYFHCQNESHEERRQLFKAQHCRGNQIGYEAARRLGDLLVANKEYDEVAIVLNAFLAEHPEGMDYVLEPYVHMLIATGQHLRVRAMLEGRPFNLRTGLLYARLLYEEQQWPALVAMTRRFISEVLTEIHSKLERLIPDDTTGWDYENDTQLLIDILARLRPEWTPSTLSGLKILQITPAVIWPNLTGSPDFSADMAWLSQGLGILATIPCPEISKCVSPEETTLFSECARLLDFPDRFRRRFERDEYWFWLTDVDRNGNPHEP